MVQFDLLAINTIQVVFRQSVLKKLGKKNSLAETDVTTWTQKNSVLVH